jgi:hypothetical protein
MNLGRLDICYKIAIEVDHEVKWKLIGDTALQSWNFGLALECWKRAGDIESLFLLYQASGNAIGLEELARLALTKGQNNIAFSSFFTLGRMEECLNILIGATRFPEAAFFARTHFPSRIDHIVDLWRDSLIKQGKSKAAQELVSPNENPEAFPDLLFGLAAEYFRDASRELGLKPASSYRNMDEQDMVVALKARNFPPEKAMEACQAIIANLALTNGSAKAPKKEQQPIKNSTPINTESANTRPVSPTKKADDPPTSIRPVSPTKKADDPPTSIRPVSPTKKANDPPTSSSISSVSSAHSAYPQAAAGMHKEKTPMQAPTAFMLPSKPDKSANVSPVNMNGSPKMADPMKNNSQHSPVVNIVAASTNPVAVKKESPVTPTFDDFEGFGSAETPDIDDDEIDALLA